MPLTPRYYGSMPWTGPIFDAHFHIIDPEFALITNQGFLPDPFNVSDYRRRTAGLNICGGAVVSGSFQGFDQEYLKVALRRLGKNFVGVTQIPATISDEKIQELDQVGVRAVRFNLKRGGSDQLENLERLALRVYEIVRWHSEFYVEAKHLKELKPILLKLPAVSIDHLGLTEEGQATLLELVEKGVRVKASGFSRCDFPVESFMKTLVQVNPSCLMFGTDLPSTRAPRPFKKQDIELLEGTFDSDTLKKILMENALEFYRIPF